MRAPFTRLARNTSVCGIVRQACQRAGIEPFGPHRLRHAAACDQLPEKAGREFLIALAGHGPLLPGADAPADRHI